MKLRWMLELGFLCLVTLVPWAKCHFLHHRRDDIFSATSKLEPLLETEQRALTLVRSYITKAQERISLLTKLVVASQEVADATLQDKRNYVANPINAYLLLKRFTVDWSILEEIIKTDVNSTQNLWTELQDIRKEDLFPTEEDLHGAAFALVRLQDVYDLNVSALANGQIRALDPGSPLSTYTTPRSLSARDCLFLGKHSLHRGYYDKAVLWLETAMTKAQVEDEEYTERDEIQPFLETAMRVHDEILLKHGPRGPEWQTNPVPFVSPNEHTQFSNREFHPRLYQYQSEADELVHYSRLCRGEQLRPAELEAMLRCRLETRNHPLLLLQPLKLEEMSLNPFIVILHGFISDSNVEKMIAAAEPKLHTSTHRNPEGGFQKSWRRTSQNAWILDGEDPVVAYYNKRIEVATGLHVEKVSSAEEYQVANYGVAGLYVPHSDFFGEAEMHIPWNQFAGDRVATLMVYLSDVEAGGATVFPRIGATLWPEKGSAAFWWNLYRDGRGDDMTRHGACPVLYGSKWVANKWIRYHDQMFEIPTFELRDGKLDDLLLY